jgi:hypothetical protein
VEAVPLSQGRSQQEWRVDITDESGKLIARGEVRLQNVAAQAADQAGHHPWHLLRVFATVGRRTGAGGCGAVAVPQPGKACFSRTAISFSTKGAGRGWSMPKRSAPDEVE